jgi:chromosomal replication initiator protein
VEIVVEIVLVVLFDLSGSLLLGRSIKSGQYDIGTLLWSSFVLSSIRNICPMINVVEGDIWVGILHSIKSKLSQESFNTWFQPLSFEGLDRSRRVIQLRAPNPVVRNWVNTNYASLVDESLAEVSLDGYLIGWSAEETLPNPAGVEDPQSQTMPALTDKEDPPAEAGQDVSASVEAPRAAAFAAVGQKRALQPPALNPKYTYDSFVVGSCNQFAHAAASAVAEAPGKTYNPLYIYGGVGLGKTHLMHACGHAIRQRNSHLQLCYISSEKFMNELINAIRYDRTQGFRERYRSVDVLLIDDVQFMAGKERTQEEFFHTFNSLYDQQKQIVISSDCPPREIPTLEERLHSRFEWGLIADIEPPDLETKVAILKRKAETMNVALPDEVALIIASRVKNNIRELEGSLVRIMAFASLRGVPITKTLAQDAMRNTMAEAESDVITIQKIQKAVAASYRIKVEELISKSNTRRLSLPRQVAMYLCKRLTKHSYPDIGRAFGGKHHTTVIHSFGKIESLVTSDANIQRLVNEITDSLGK